MAGVNVMVAAALLVAVANLLALQPPHVAMGKYPYRDYSLVQYPLSNVMEINNVMENYENYDYDLENFDMVHGYSYIHKLLLLHRGYGGNREWDFGGIAASCHLKQMEEQNFRESSLPVNVSSTSSPVETPSTAPIGTSKTISLTVIVMLIASSVLLTLVVVMVVLLSASFVYLCLRRQRQVRPSMPNESSRMRSLAPANARNRMFSLEELREATRNFSEANLIGEGGFGKVYKAHFPDGVIRAVKVEKGKTSPVNRNSTFVDEPEEVAHLQRVHHRHLVNFIGFCEYEGPWILVFEYLPNGSVYDRLHSNGIGIEAATRAQLLPLSWSSRMNIIYQVACALDYLHHGIDPPIVHRDVKSANILLTSRDSAKLADFGISKAGPTDASRFLSVQTGIKGSRGYIDPEYVITEFLSSKSDVYSFGVVVLELITGCKAMKDGDLLSEWALEFLKDSSANVDDFVDRRLAGDWNAEDLFILCDLVKKCLEENGQLRPTMQEVLTELRMRPFSGVPDERMYTASDFSETPDESVYAGSDFSAVPEEPMYAASGFSGVPDELMYTALDCSGVSDEQMYTASESRSSS